MSQPTSLSLILLTYYLATKAAEFQTILEVEEQKIDKGLNTLKVLQSRPPFTYRMVYQNEKIKTPFLGACELFICPCNLSQPFPYHAVYCHQEIRL